MPAIKSSRVWAAIANLFWLVYLREKIPSVLESNSELFTYVHGSETDSSIRARTDLFTH